MSEVETTSTNPESSVYQISTRRSSRASPVPSMMSESVDAAPPSHQMDKAPATSTNDVATNQPRRIVTRRSSRTSPMREVKTNRDTSTRNGLQPISENVEDNDENDTPSIAVTTAKAPTPKSLKKRTRRASTVASTTVSSTHRKNELKKKTPLKTRKRKVTEDVSDCVATKEEIKKSKCRSIKKAKLEMSESSEEEADESRHEEKNSKLTKKQPTPKEDNASQTPMSISPPLLSSVPVHVASPLSIPTKQILSPKSQFSSSCSLSSVPPPSVISQYNESQVNYAPYSPGNVDAPATPHTVTTDQPLPLNLHVQSPQARNIVPKKRHRTSQTPPTQWADKSTHSVYRGDQQNSPNAVPQYTSYNHESPRPQTSLTNQAPFNHAVAIKTQKSCNEVIQPMTPPAATTLSTFEPVTPVSAMPVSSSISGAFTPVSTVLTRLGMNGVSGISEVTRNYYFDAHNRTPRDDQNIIYELQTPKNSNIADGSVIYSNQHQHYTDKLNNQIEAAKTPLVMNDPSPHSNACPQVCHQKGHIHGCLTCAGVSDHMSVNALAEAKHVSFFIRNTDKDKLKMVYNLFFFKLTFFNIFFYLFRRHKMRDFI